MFSFLRAVFLYSCTVVLSKSVFFNVIPHSRSVFWSQLLTCRWSSSEHEIQVENVHFDSWLWFDGDLVRIFTPYLHKVNDSGELLSNRVLTVMCWLMAVGTEVTGRDNSVWISICRTRNEALKEKFHTQDPVIMCSWHYSVNKTPSHVILHLFVVLALMFLTQRVKFNKWKIEAA